MEVIKENFSDKSAEQIAFEMAKERVHKLKKFYIHLFIYAIAVVVYVLKTYFGAPLNFWPIHFLNEFVMCVWTFIIAVKAIRIFFKEHFFGTNWEQRKINEILEKENNSNKKWN
jgi:uncharacterized protein YacL